MIAIVSHRHADFDALGAVVAAHALIPDAVPVIDTGNPAVEAFLATHRDALGIQRGAQTDWPAVAHLLVVDTQDPARLDVVPADVLARVTWQVIDHHPALGLIQGDVQVEAVGSATALVVEKLRKQGVVPTAMEATAMALGIHADTGGLLYPKTTVRDAESYAWLLGQGANLAIVRQFSQHRLPEEGQALLESLLQQGHPVTIAGYGGEAAAVACGEHVEDLSGVVGSWADIVGKPVVVAAVGMRGDVHLLGRSSLSGIDLVTAWQSLGARGHAEACYVRLKHRQPADVLDEALHLLTSSLPEAPPVRQIMTAPVLTITPQTTVAAASQLLETWGHGTLPVTDAAGRPVGLVSRSELDKARRHGLREAPVKAVMRKPTCVGPELPLSDVPERLAAATLHRLLVVDGGTLIGIVAGSDVVRRLYGSKLGLGLDRPGPEALARRIREWGGKTVLDLLHEAGAAAARYGVALYWVGGSVRDLLLNRPAPPDIDLVVDGDGIAFARAWAAELGLRPAVHGQFGTAKIDMPAGPVDIASSRRETYAHPGAQPDVQFSPISLDLARRDFSVNALAVRLDPPYFGQLLDFFGGWQDLQTNCLAVLHPLSYLEDPSRLWRAVRFEAQLGFRLSPGDEDRAKETMAGGTFDGYLNHRIAQEMRLLFTRAARPWESLLRLDDLGALRPLGLSVSGELVERFQRFAVQREALAVPADEVWLGYLALLLLDVPEARRETMLAAMKLGEGDLQRLRAVWRLMTQTVPVDDTDLYFWAEGQPALALAGVAAQGDEPADRVDRFWSHLRHLRPDLTGHDLMAMGFRPGPMFGRVLAAVLRAKLAGEVASPEDARRLAARLAAAEEIDAARPE